MFEIVLGSVFYNPITKISLFMLVNISFNTFKSYAPYCAFYYFGIHKLLLKIKCPVDSIIRKRFSIPF